MSSKRALVAASPTDEDAVRGMLGWSSVARTGFSIADAAGAGDLPTAADTFVLLIGTDTRGQVGLLRLVEAAAAGGARLIGVNLDEWRLKNPLTVPHVFSNKGALFVPFSAPIIAWALRHWTRPEPPVDDFQCGLGVYRDLGYTIDGHVARPPFR